MRRHRFAVTLSPAGVQMKRPQSRKSVLSQAMPDLMLGVVTRTGD